MIGVNSLYEKNIIHKEYQIIKKKSFCELRKMGGYLMDDSETTLNLYRKNILNFSGDVLCLGLGLGLMGFNYAHLCKSFSYVEIEKSLIELISQKQKNIIYINADCYSFIPTKKYDFIFIDIFRSLTPLAQLKAIQLVEKFKEYLTPAGKISFLKL